jgi:hypothetical protein
MLQPTRKDVEYTQPSIDRNMQRMLKTICSKYISTMKTHQQLRREEASERIEPLLAGQLQDSLALVILYTTNSFNTAFAAMPEITKVSVGFSIQQKPRGARRVIA